MEGGGKRFRAARYGEHALHLSGYSSYQVTLCILPESSLTTLTSTKEGLLRCLYGEDSITWENLDYSQVSLLLAPDGDIITAPCKLNYRN